MGVDAVAPSSTLLDSRGAAVRWVVAIGVVVLLAMGALLSGRRYAGALDADLPLAALGPTAALAGATVLAGRVAWRRSLAESEHSVSRLAELAIAWGGSIGLILVAIGCSDFSRTRDWLIWLPLVIVDQFHRHWFLHGAWLPGALPKERGPKIGLYEPEVGPAGVAAAADADELVLQHLIRVRDAAGEESIRGTLHAPFAAGQRTATLHVGFCPPLERLPQVEVHAGDMPAAQVKVVQALAHGARLEVRLGEPAAKSCSISIDFSAIPLAASTGGTRMNADFMDKRG